MILCYCPNSGRSCRDEKIEKEGEYVVDTRKLMAALVASGYNQRGLAAKMNMSKNTLNAKINGKSSITLDEALLLGELLNLTKVDFDYIFLH
jgi:DNA-binding XRE family transcriptional regulator